MYVLSKTVSVNSITNWNEILNDFETSFCLFKTLRKLFYHYCCKSFLIYLLTSYKDIQECLWWLYNCSPSTYSISTNFMRYLFDLYHSYAERNITNSFISIHVSILFSASCKPHLDLSIIVSLLLMFLC